MSVTRSGSRIQGILAVCKLQDAGFDVIFFSCKKKGGILFEVETGRTIQLQEVAGLYFLPYNPFDIGENKNSSTAVSGSSDTFVFMAISQELLEHWRSGHMVCPGNFKREQCPECCVGIGSRGSHRAVRPARAVPSGPLQQQSGDYWGTVSPVSIRGCTILLVVICDVLGFVWLWPLGSKSQIVEVLRSHVRSLRARYGRDLSDRVTWCIRLDNEIVNRQTAIQELAKELRIVFTYPPPYTPEGNGIVERFMRVVGTYTALLHHLVDSRLWCFAVEFIRDAYNNRPRPRYQRAKQYNNLSPAEALAKAFPHSITKTIPLHRQRRFGCLAYYANEPKKDIRKLEEKWIRSVFLGYSEKNSSWLFGHWVEEKGKKRATFKTSESDNARFLEGVLVANVDDLKRDSAKLTLNFPEIERKLMVSSG